MIKLIEGKFVNNPVMDSGKVEQTMFEYWKLVKGSSDYINISDRLISSGIPATILKKVAKELLQNA